MNTALLQRCSVPLPCLCRRASTSVGTIRFFRHFSSLSDKGFAFPVRKYRVVDRLPGLHFSRSLPVGTVEGNAPLNRTLFSTYNSSTEMAGEEEKKKSRRGRKKKASNLGQISEQAGAWSAHSNSFREVHADFWATLPPSIQTIMDVETLGGEPSRAWFQQQKGEVDDEKLYRLFTARTLAGRILGAKDTHCLTCWLPHDLCLCKDFAPAPCKLWEGMRIWLYLHPKEYHRINNTGKMVPFALGRSGADLRVCGVQEHEREMMDAMAASGPGRSWVLYPKQNEGALVARCEETHQLRRTSLTPAAAAAAEAKTSAGEPQPEGDGLMHFVLLDGTWTNSRAMYKRLQRLASESGVDLPCLSLCGKESAFAVLRPQPSMDRTCTAAAASTLLRELHVNPDFADLGMERAADSVDDALTFLLERLRVLRGRTGKAEIRLPSQKQLRARALREQREREARGEGEGGGDGLEGDEKVASAGEGGGNTTGN
eukprot:jgi/Mesvir1/3582/Mv12045-RA.1